MSYYLRNKNEVLQRMADDTVIAVVPIVSFINEHTKYLTVMSFTSRKDAQEFKDEHKIALRNFTVSNNLDYEL